MRLTFRILCNMYQTSCKTFFFNVISWVDLAIHVFQSFCRLAKYLKLSSYKILRESGKLVSPRSQKKYIVDANSRPSCESTINNWLCLCLRLGTNCVRNLAEATIIWVPEVSLSTLDMTELLIRYCIMIGKGSVGRERLFISGAT